MNTSNNENKEKPKDAEEKVNDSSSPRRSSRKSAKRNSDAPSSADASKIKKRKTRIDSKAKEEATKEMRALKIVTPEDSVDIGPRFFFKQVSLVKKENNQVVLTPGVGFEVTIYNCEQKRYLVAITVPKNGSNPSFWVSDEHGDLEKIESVPITEIVKFVGPPKFDESIFDKFTEQERKNWDGKIKSLHEREKLKSSSTHSTHESSMSVESLNILHKQTQQQAEEIQKLRAENNQLREENKQLIGTIHLEFLFFLY